MLRMHEHDGIFEIEYSGGMTDDEYREVRDRLLADDGDGDGGADADAGVRMLLRVGDVGLAHVQPRAMLDDLRSAPELLRRIRRVAIVTEAGWLETAANGMRTLTRVEVRTFPASGEEQALAWLRAA